MSVKLKLKVDGKHAERMASVMGIPLGGKEQQPSYQPKSNKDFPHVPKKNRGRKQ